MLSIYTFSHYKCVLPFRKYNLGSLQNVGLKLDFSVVCTNPAMYIMVKVLIYSILTLMNA